MADSNGQHVSKVRVSADKPHPACFFYRPDGKIQLTVQVYVGDAKTATALVNKVAPVETSNPASDPTGWKGGDESTDDGAVYAVSKGSGGGHRDHQPEAKRKGTHSGQEGYRCPEALGSGLHTGE